MSVYVSSSARSDMLRVQALRLQRDLAAAQVEAATSRKNDLGLAVGGTIGRSVSLRADMSRVETLMSTNSIAAGRLDATQTSLSNLAKIVDKVQQTAFGALGPTGRTSLASGARDALGQMSAAMNASVGGQPVFAGLKTDASPFANYLNAASPPKAALDVAFQAAFGFPQDDPQVANITAQQLKSFIEGPFQALFNDAAWTTTWSSASDLRMSGRISPDQSIETSITANETAFRKTAAALVMAADLGTKGLNDNAFQELLSQTRKTLGESSTGLVELQATVGTMQDRITTASQTMKASLTTLNHSINDIESVDPFEASTRVTDLMQRLETSYALTARIQKLSLLNYL